MSDCLVYVFLFSCPLRRRSPLVLYIAQTRRLAPVLELGHHPIHAVFMVGLPYQTARSACMSRSNRAYDGDESVTCHSVKIYAMQATWAVLSCPTVTYESKSQRRKKARVFEIGGGPTSKVPTVAAQITSHPPASAPSAARGAGAANHTTSCFFMSD